MLLCDLNCDMGEGIENEEALMPCITSANIACGFHAGDKQTMRKVIDLCIQNGVAIGAHPSYPDRENFGRKDLIGVSLAPKDVQHIVSEQIFTLQKIAEERGAKLNHVKPHGALYNRAAWDTEVGGFICSALKEIDPALSLYGLSGCALEKISEGAGLHFVNEVFADRTYKVDGSLTPRSGRNALIEDEEGAVRQVMQMVYHQQVTSISGVTISIKAETICIHGDGKHVVSLAKRLYKELCKRPA